MNRLLHGLPISIAFLSLLVGITVGYGPIDVNSIEPLTLSWNQIHWLVKDQIKEVEELKMEHDEIYNQITECFGLEMCVEEFDLKDIEPGRRLHHLGLRKMSVASLVSQDLLKQREQLHTARQKLEDDLREKQRLLKIAEKQQILQEQLRREQEQEEARKRLEEQRLRIANLPSKSSSSSSRTSSSSFSSSSSSSSSYSSSSSITGTGGSPGSVWGFNSSWPDNTVYGPKPQVYQNRYEYTYGRRTNSQNPPRNTYQG